MSVTKAELVRINENLQAMVRALLQENGALRADREKLSQSLLASTEQTEVLTTRYRRLVAYMKQLHAWLSAKET